MPITSDILRELLICFLSLIRYTRLCGVASPTFARTLDFITSHQGNDPHPYQLRPSSTFPPPHIATMRFSSTLLLVLPAIAVAEEQIPLLDKVLGFFNKATAAVSSAIPASPSAPINAAAEKGAAKAAAAIQHPITWDNWRETLTVDPTASTPTTQDWLVFVTGGNKTCFGLCGNATKAWNVCRKPVHLRNGSELTYHRLLSQSLPQSQMRPSSPFSTASRRTSCAIPGLSAHHRFTTSRSPSRDLISPHLSPPFATSH